MTPINPSLPFRGSLATLFVVVSLAAMYWLAILPEIDGRQERIELYIFCLMLVGGVAGVVVFFVGIIASILTWDFRVTDDVGQTILAATFTGIGIAFGSWWVLTRVFDMSIP